MFTAAVCTINTDAKGEGGFGMNWKIGIDMYALLCIKQTTSENLVHSTGSSIQCALVT